MKPTNSMKKRGLPAALILALSLGMLILAAATAQALVSVNIEVKPVFTTGEQVYFSYTLTSDASEQIEYLPSVNCFNAPRALLELKTLQLQKNIPVNKRYDYLAVNETMESQLCSAAVLITRPYNLETTKQFSISVEQAAEPAEQAPGTRIYLVLTFILVIILAVAALMVLAYFLYKRWLAKRGKNEDKTKRDIKIY